MTPNKITPRHSEPMSFGDILATCFPGPKGTRTNWIESFATPRTRRGPRKLPARYAPKATASATAQAPAQANAAPVKITAEARRFALLKQYSSMSYGPARSALFAKFKSQILQAREEAIAEVRKNF